MHKLIMAGFAFAGATAAAHYLLPYGALPYVAAGALLLAVIAALALRGLWRTRLLIVLLFCSAALGWYSLYTRIYFVPAQSMADTTAVVTVRVLEYPERDGDYSGVDVRLSERGMPPLNISVYDYDGLMPELRAGDLAELELDFRGALERFGEESDYYAARGTHLRAYYRGCAEVSRDAVSALFFPQELQRLMRESIERVFPEDVRSLALALIAGDTDGVYEDHELENALSVTGLMHIVSISGMHLAFLYSAVRQLVGARRAKRFAAPLIIVYTFMVGCSSAVVRACIMLLITMATPREREAHPLTSLAFALMLLLIANPLSVGSVSLQLSFASMLGLVTVGDAVKNKLMDDVAPQPCPFILGVIIANVASSIGATVFTCPLIILTFGYVSLVSPIVNLLVLWMVSAAFTLSFAAAALGMLLPFLGVAAAWLAAWPARAFVFVCELFAKLPYAAVYTGDKFVVVWVGFTYLAAALAVFTRKSVHRLRALTAVCCSAALLVVVIAAASIRSSRERSVTVLDVGQGLSAVFLAGENAAVIDCGGMGTVEGAGSTASNFLLSRGRYDIDALVLTHLHSDHANGAAELITRLDVGAVYIPAGADDSDDELAAILATAKDTETPVVEVSEDVTVRFGELELELFAPVGAGDENERGLVIHAAIGDYDTIVTGDAGVEVERKLVELGKLGRAELLVAGHHGSNYSSSFELIDAVRPETVVISVGYNSYGHPTEGALFRLGVRGADIYRSDLNGDVTVRIDENG